MINVETKDHKPLTEPYILRIKGWRQERFYEEAPDNRICEFVKGELIMYSPASAEHQDVVVFISTLLRDYCSKFDLGTVLQGPAVVNILPEVDREPDIFVIPPEQSRLARGIPIRAIPNFIIEVSCTTQDIDLGEKKRDYEQAGVKEYWVVDIENKVIYAHVLKEGRYDVSRYADGNLNSIAIAGFFIKAQWLWQSPLPSTLDCLINEILK